ncbi:hypothetical protein EBT16_02680 [bacterium]|nr:hypothetical protein [bacterium]
MRDVIKPANSFSNLLYDTDAGRVYQKVAVSVPGNAIDWVDTNLTIDDSSFLSITATGFIDTNGNAAEGRVYPNGMACTTATCRNCRLNSSFNRGALIGKIGAAGAPFLISKGIEIPVVWGGRLYLSANNTACASSASSSAFTVSVGIQPSTTTIYGYSIPGNAAVAATWTDTGLDVTNDIYVDFFASGTVDLNGSAAGQAYGPAGVAGACPTCPVPGFNKGALLGRIGPSGTVFSVGTTRRNVRSGAGGRLSFLVNDPNRADNTGSFTVMVYAKGQSDRFKNLNMNPNVAGSGSIIFTDALHSDAIVTYQRDENGDYDFAGIYARDFDDSYDVLVSRSDFAYVSRSRNGVRYFWSRDKTPASSQSLLLQTVEAVPYATQNGLLGYFQALNSVQVESRILPHCTRNSTCVGYYGKPYADAWWFQIGPKDSPDCEIEKVFIREGGCFTADTEIQMANGQSKKVSELRENQFIWNPHYQTGIRIKKIVKGPEKKPLYWVRVGEKSLTVTEDHPFLTETGWVQAQALKPGQRLFGEGEGKTVSEVTKLKYKGPEDVWNFELETDEPLGHVILANGIPTGDLTTQTRIKKGPQSVP